MIDKLIYQLNESARWLMNCYNLPFLFEIAIPVLVNLPLPT